MVVSQVQQPAENYQIWVRFWFPDSKRGPIDAVAVSSAAHRYIASAYTIMSSLIVFNIWAMIIAAGFYFYLRKEGNKVSDISMSLWNKRAATHQSITDTLLYARDDLKRWWYYPLLFAIISAWAASMAAGILVPSQIFLGNAAPVNPRSVYVPSNNYSTFPELYDIFALDIQPSLRAAGAALVANQTLRNKVVVGEPIPLGRYEDLGPIQQINYSYNVTGADLGLQRVPQLQLTVLGSCITDYNLLVRTEDLGGGINQDTYMSPIGDSTYNISLYDSQAPSARFLTPTEPEDSRNISWAAIVSSVDRFSYTTSDDPWYKTIPNPYYDSTDKYSIENIVQPGRPVLSCWQSDVWSYHDRTASISDLRAILSQEEMSDGMATILTRYLSIPAVVNLGNHLGVGALHSSSSAVWTSFDAEASSIHKDLEQLVLGAYIATVDTLTDTTLYMRPDLTGRTADNKVLANMAQDGLDRPLDGIGDFIVFSRDVAALSVGAVIVIPVLAVATWILMQVVLAMTPLKKATALEVIEFFQDVTRQFGDATVQMKDGRPEWKL